MQEIERVVDFLQREELTLTTAESCTCGLMASLMGDIPGCGQVLDSAYAYDMGPVLFKPTLTVAPQTFRTSRDGALAYFVGGDKAFPNDSGFALKGWRKCEAKNAGIVITGNSAISMGNVSMWDTKGNMTMVDKTWGWTRGATGCVWCNCPRAMVMRIWYKSPKARHPPPIWNAC